MHPLEVPGEESTALEILDFRPRWLTTNYGFIMRRGRTPSPAATAFMRLAREVEAEVDRLGGLLGERFGPSPSAG